MAGLPAELRYVPIDAPLVESASDTDIEPLNEPPFGVIVGVLTVIFFKSLVDAE